jgi:hypothetical protein
MVALTDGRQPQVKFTRYLRLKFGGMLFDYASSVVTATSSPS